MPRATWIEYESDSYRVWGHSTGDLMLEKTVTGESVYVQGSEATTLSYELEKIPADTVDLIDDYLSDYFTE
jgi:hypothetical protein